MDSRPEDCEACPLENVAPDKTPASDPLEAAIADLKVGEMRLSAGVNIVLEGASNPHLFVLVRGVGFRHKSLANGRRQILSYAFPGDLIGVQGVLLGTMQHSVDAISDVELAVLERGCLARLFEARPEAAYQIAWRGARDECILDETLLAVGRRTAVESAAWLLVLLHQRACVAGLALKGRLAFPLTQQHVADTLGLSTVHTNRTLKRLADEKLIAWQDRGCVIRDEAGLRKLADWQGLG